MKDNRFYTNYLIPNEILDRYPTSMQMALKHLGEQLTERLFCEVQKGEKIVCLKDATTNDNYPRNMTELKQEIRITDLVRCKDCKFNYANQIPSDDVCQLCVELPITKDFFCAHGEMMNEVEDENN